MMLCSELIKRLDELAPPQLAMSWDNPGFQAGRADKEVHKVLVALDATDEVVEQAIREGADMIVTHHPLIFHPLKQVNDQNFIGRRIVRMLQADICCFAMHTNFDIAPRCMADLAAAMIGLAAEEPLEVTGEAEGKPIGIGKVGTLPEGRTVRELARFVKERFELPFVTMYGADRVDEPVSRIAISPGSGGSMIGEAVRKHVQVLITGDIGHHDGIDAAANGMAVIDAGHYGIEQIFIPFIQKYITEASGGRITAVMAKRRFPEEVLL